MSELVQLKHITNKGLRGGAPSRRKLLGSAEAGQFFEKQAIFNAIKSHSARYQNHLKELDF